MKKKLAYLIATCFVGKCPKAPGTCGSALAALIAWLVPCPFVLTGLLIFSIFAGIAAIKVVTKTLANKDPGYVVIDEVAGQTLAYLIFWGFYKQLSLLAILGGFLLFRFFDISKIWPASFFDRQHTPTAVMMDDLVAGTYAGLALGLIFYLF